MLFRGSPGNAYNIGSPLDTSILDLASQIADYFGLSVRVHKTADRNAPPNRYIPNTDKAFSLGLRQAISLDQAIERTATYYRQYGVS